MNDTNPSGNPISRALAATATLTLFLAMAWMAQAQSYSIEWFTLDGGGGTSAGGDYTLSGTIGQSDATPTTLSGGDYTLQGGFWPGLAVAIPGEQPTLFIQWSGANVIISWSPATPGFSLEQTDNLATLIWTSAPSGNPVPVPASGTARFYRLHKP
jgi:hypothetical protein